METKNMVREKELAPPPTKEEARAANAGETRTVKRVGRNRALGVLAGGAAVGAGAIGAIAYENIPAVHRAVDPAFLDHIKGESLSSEASTEVFDPTADKQTVKAGVNARPISEDKALALAKENPPQLHEGDFPTLPLVFIGKLKDGDEAIIDTDYVDQAYNPIEQKPDRVNAGREIIFKNAGTELGLTLEEYEVFQIDPFMHKDEPHFAGVVIRFNDPQGIPHTVIIQAPEDIRHLAPAKIIKNAPTVGKNGKITNKYYEEIKDQKGVVVNGPETILTTTKDKAKVRIGGAAMLDEYPKGLVAKITFIDQDGQMVFPE